VSFHSRRRPVVFPQAEHARFAAVFALAWAEPPPLPFAAFVRGVADHDRGYGELDDDPIGGAMSEERWLAIQRRGFAPRGDDPVVDLVVAMHVRRLIGEGEAFEEVDALLPSLLSRAGVRREAAEAADAITNVCDVISFEFCFEEPNEREVRGYRVAVDGEGGIEVDPWPFAVPRLVGLVTAFEEDGYPERLVPVVTPFETRPKGPIARGALGDAP
jgi:hypothetical protein